MALICSTCGHKQFEHDENDLTTIRCVGCDRIFSREKLLRENGENIDVEMTEIKNEVIKDITQQLRKNLQQAFRGSKHIKIK